MKITTLISCLLILLCAGCNELKPKGEKEIRAFVTQWNDSHTQLKASFLEANYMDVVQYYGEERTRFQVQKDKNLLFEQFPDYRQQIKDDQLTITKKGATHLVEFTKQVKYDGREAEYESYLLLTLFNSKFIILREGVTNEKKYKNIPIFPASREKQLTATENRQLFGDFNGDDISDYAYVEHPVVKDNPLGVSAIAAVTCEGSCTSTIHFSAPSLSAIAIEGVYKSQLDNLQDLNADGADEIGFWDIKPTSKSLHIYDATTGKLLIPPVTINTAVHKNLKLIDVFKKTGTKSITVTRSVNRDGKWDLESETVKLK